MRNCLLVITAILFCLSSASLKAQANLDTVNGRLNQLDTAAQTSFDAGKYPEALASYKEAFELCRSTLKQIPNEPTLTESAYHYLTMLARCFDRLDQPADALSMQTPGAQGYGNIARATTATPELKNRAATELGNLSWMQLHARDFNGALKSTREALQIDPTVVWVNTNLAHSLVLTGQVEEGKKIYLANKDSVLEDGRAYRDVVFEDAKILREKAGITQLDAVLASVFGPSPSSAPSIPTAQPTISAGLPQQGAASPGKATPSANPPLTLKDFEALEKGSSWGKTILVVVFCGLIFVFVIGLIILFWWFAKKRTQKLQALATQLGLNFRARPVLGDENLLNGTYLVQNHGGARAIGNIMELRRGQDQVFIFDYTYHTGFGQKRRTLHQTLYYVASPRLSLPAFLLRQESWGEKLTQWLGAKDINFPENPTFSGKFILQGQDEASIRRVFSPGVQQQCLTQPRMYMEGRADRLFFFIPAKTLSPDDLQAFLNAGHAMVDQFASSGAAAGSAPSTAAPSLPSAPKAGGPPPLPGAGS